MNSLRTIFDRDKESEPNSWLRSQELSFGLGLADTVLCHVPGAKVRARVKQTLAL